VQCFLAHNGVSVSPDPLPLPHSWPAGPPEHGPLLPRGHVGALGAGLLPPLSPSQHRVTTFATAPASFSFVTRGRGIGMCVREPQPLLCLPLPCCCRTVRPDARNFCWTCPGDPSPNPTWPDPALCWESDPQGVGTSSFPLCPVLSASACPPLHSTQELEVSTHLAFSLSGRVIVEPPGSVASLHLGQGRLCSRDPSSIRPVAAKSAHATGSLPSYQPSADHPPAPLMSPRPCPPHSEHTS